MRTFYAWILCCLKAAQYMLYRVRLAKAPDLTRYYPYWTPWWGSVLGWKRSLFIVHPERCPAAGPVVFAGNHAKLDDPLFVWGAVYEASGGKLPIRFMMRDDYFAGFPWDYLPFSVNELTALGGAVGISRDNVQYTQLKPLMQTLEADGGFVMFPGRSRSRGGTLIEYRDGIDEPGSVSFFLAHVSRRQPDKRILAVPVTRIFNPVSGRNAMTFGEPMALERGADRAAQRDFDAALVERLGDLVEVHALHVLSGLVYLNCLHGRARPIPIVDWAAAVARARAGWAHPYLDPDLKADPDRAVRAALRYLAKRGMVRIQGGAAAPLPGAVLYCPPLTGRYRKRNPVKYHVNQAMHLDELIARWEANAP